MQYKRFAVECNKNYFARIFRYPDTYPFELFGLPLHWHRDYEIIYVETGSLTIQKIDCTITLNAGDVYFINSEEVHTYNTLDHDNLKFIAINFSIRAMQPYFANPYELLSFKIDSEHAKTKIANSMHRLFSCTNFYDRLEVLKIKSVLNNISYYLLRDCLDTSIKYFLGSETDDFICARSAAHYMEENYKNNITLEEISNFVGMTPAHFSKYFKDKVDLTFTQYLRRIRLEHAINDILIHNATVKEAALNNGFPNVNSFINSCKNEYGKTPMELKLYNSNQV